MHDEDPDIRQAWEELTNPLTIAEYEMWQAERQSRLRTALAEGAPIDDILREKFDGDSGEVH